MHIYKMATIFRLFPLDFVVDTEKAEGADPEFSVVGVETPTAEGWRQHTILLIFRKATWNKNAFQ